MRRRALIVVEYGRENGRPVEADDWAQAIAAGARLEGLHVQSVHLNVEVLEDEPS